MKKNELNFKLLTVPYKYARELEEQLIEARAEIERKNMIKSVDGVDTLKLGDGSTLMASVKIPGKTLRESPSSPVIARK